ncbi:ornithine aminotransferase, mitochondrial [Adelges cooleyi]|uniref:ornithine aminotransferase, mitochondrial n=1 Tax=Adelges cooleyi TaxID=133065 RepID=UPI00217FB6F7|nr:ornithine aminotransferase, mitochondrial [Adelges cooleyi]XP_050439141.1 ornithine aminotransferase, mitochondrial [Adelges cooleyi]XP_050439142.1 ornithine aminotransferase, mitochondrial [Adelges cooleyi]
MSVLQNRGSNLLKHARLFNNVSVARLMSGKAKTSAEVILREKKVSAFNYDPLSVVISRGEGIYMWDVEGKKYFDFLGGFATLNQGHCHPKILKAMTDQLATLHHTSRAIHHDCLYELNEFLTKTFGYDKVLNMNTGVEGGETSIKIARKWGYRVKKIPENQAQVVFAHGNFWGRTIAAISASTDPNSFNEFGPHVPGYQIVPYDDLGKLEQLLRNPNVCAFMVEPVQGEAGAVVPSPGYLKGVRELCDKYNVLWIDDEVQAGLGRTGKLLAVDYDGVRPDVLILGKALSGGVYPISAVLANDDIMGVLTPGTHGSTYGGNPLACKIALAALDVILNDGLIDNAFKMGELFRSELTARLDKKKLVQVRGRGLLNAVVLDPKYSADSSVVSLAIKENGLVTKPIGTNMLRFSPPLTITESELRQGIDIIVNTINGLSSE